jgi:LysR family nitrogen assimilation transcriptional regulator
LKLVIPARPNVLRAQVEHTLSRKGMAFRLVVETDTLTLCLELARRGIGYTVVPACAVHTHGLGKSISWAPIRGLYMTWALCENQARTHSPAVREGRRLVFATVVEALASGQWFGAEAASTSVNKVGAEVQRK